MRVFEVYSADEEEYEVRGIFSSVDKARKWIKEHPDTYVSGIAEHELDNPEFRLIVHDA